MDLETINVGEGIQEVVAISFKNNKHSKLFLIDNELFKINRDEAVKQLWINFFDFLKEYKGVIYTHNLGSFDGIFIYRNLFKHFDSSFINSLINDENKFITITLKNPDYNIF